VTLETRRWLVPIAATWLVACHGSSDAGARSRPTPEPSAVPTVSAPKTTATPEKTAAPPPAASPTSTASPKPKRDLHPLSPSAPGCLEMYSACRPDGMCTSAPFELSCGAVGTIPGGDTVRCVCP
jgi:hypothetical protein